MTDIVAEVKLEIESLHDFFANWYNGKLPRESLSTQLIARLHPDFQFISPEGLALNREALIEGIGADFGLQSGFAIQIRDVTVRHEFPGHLLATYTEWQGGGSAETENARLTSAVLTRGKPCVWLHVHETWLPPQVN